jgi:hypothetical protein
VKTKTNQKENKMSDNKFKYFIITTDAVVKANNKTDAEKVFMGRRNVDGELLFKSTDIERISSIEAREQIAELTA